MKRLGLDYPELAKINPRIIYGAISGYGQTGPAAGRPAYAPVIHASTGYDMAHLFYQQGRERPDNCGIFVADYASGAYALGGILAALHQRHVTGKGQMVDVSMFEALVGMLLGEVNRAQFDFEMPSRPMYGPVEAKDGYVMLATASERTFQDMATAAGRRDWLTDPRFEKYADRRMNWDQFVDEFEAWSKTLTVKECVAALEKHGVPCSPYLTVTEALQDPQVEHRGSLCTIEDSAGTYKSPAPPFRFSGSPLQSGPKVAEPRRAYKERPGGGRPQRRRDQGPGEMIDPRTPILVGCGQITDTTSQPSSERSRCRLLRRSRAARARRHRRRDRSAMRLAARSMRWRSWNSSATSARASPRPSAAAPTRPRASPTAWHAHAAPAALHPSGRQHAPVPRQPLRRGDRAAARPSWR